MMKQFCARKGMSDFEKMKEIMEKCGCHVSDSESEVSQ